jgi:hypothetical protein
MKKGQYKFLIFIISCAYGVWISYIARYWSFDYNALAKSVIHYRENGYEGFLEILLNNTVLIIIWDGLFYFTTPNTSLDLLYGFAAFFRLYVFFTKFKSRLTIPVFVATSVVMDINTCRYSLVVSLIILLLPYVNKYLLMLLSFPLHTLAPAWAFLLSPATGKVLLSGGMVVFLLIAPDYFTRHFADLEDAFPRIALVYSALVILLLIAFYKIIKPYLFNYLLIIFGIGLVYAQGGVINLAYYYRLADLAFQTILVHILIARASCRDALNFSYLQISVLLAVLSISISYSYILIGGNIWRFF